MSTEYKKGDRVRRINVNNGAYGAKVGQEGTVVSTDSRFVYVDYQPRDPLCTQQRGPEGWHLENAKLVTTTFNVGDKVAYRATPDVLAGEVVAIFPNANPKQQIAVMLARGDKAIRLRPIDGAYYSYSSEDDFVPLRRPVVTKKVWITSWIGTSGEIACFSYQEKNNAEREAATQRKHGHPASVTEVDVTVDPN